MTDTIWPPDLSETRESKYIVLVQSLRAAIRSGELSEGHKLPPVRDLAWKLGVTPGTVARAYKLAVDEGLLSSAVGRGTFVAPGRPKEEPVAVPLIPLEISDDIDLRGIRVPDVGQDAVVSTLMRQVDCGSRGAYVDIPTPERDRAAREAVAKWIGPDRVGRLHVDDIVLGLGAQHTVILTLQACLYGPSPVILTEELGFPGVRHAARLLRAQTVGVAMDQFGLRPDRLEEALRKHGGQVLVTSAEVHSPTTIRTSDHRKQEIADIARRFDLQIIEDDCHRVTRGAGVSYRAICPERAWYVSSLTKSVSAALRFGYVACAAGQARQLLQVTQSSFYGLPVPILDICAELISSGAAEDIRGKVEAEIVARVKTAVNVLGKWQLRWRPDVPFVWLRLPQGWRGSTFVMACGAERIGIKSADEFALSDGLAPNAIRIALNPDIPMPEFEAILQKISALLEKPPATVDT